MFTAGGGQERSGDPERGGLQREGSWQPAGRQAQEHPPLSGAPFPTEGADMQALRPTPLLGDLD